MGGRVVFVQPAQGYRVAIDPILLAASVPATRGDRILDAGCGAGAATLCLASRIAECRITGVDLDPDATALARANAAANQASDHIDIVTASLPAFASEHKAEFDHVMTNPPFYEQGHHTPSPRLGKASSHGEGEISLADWIAAAALALKPAGRLTMIHRADKIGAILSGLNGKFGAATIAPLWPRTGVEAKRIVVTAIKGRRTLPRIVPGLVLHEADGRYTAAADAILRDAAPFDFGQIST